MKGRTITRILSLLFTCVLLFLLSRAIENTASELEATEAERLLTALKTAAVESYSLYGYYPSTVDELAKQYGIVINEEKYHIHYEAFAPNIMPDIAIYRKGNS